MNKGIGYLARRIGNNPYMLFSYASKYGLLNWMSDKLFLKIIFRARLEKKIDLENPKTFNEKIQWLKLNDRKAIYTTMVDKCEVKGYVANIIGEQYIIPTLGVWDKFDDIDFEALPDQFVLKCTHDSGGLVIVKDKSKLDKAGAKRKIEKSLNRDYYLVGREWPYKNVPRKIVCEKFMSEPGKDDLIDYKFFCFNGQPVYCQVITDRNTEEHIDFFDMKWKHMEFTGLAPLHKPFSNSPVPVSVPVTFDKMRLFAERLSKSIPFLRVDFYEISGQLYFGELTFFPASGFGVFEPMEWNKKIGDLLTLPKH